LPDDAWIKASARCWPQLGRIAPYWYYGDRDSDTVKQLCDELDFVVDVRPALLSFDEDRWVDSGILDGFRPSPEGEQFAPPAETDGHVTALFQDFLHRYSEELIPRYGMQALGIDSIDGREVAYRDPRLVTLEIGKFPNAIIRKLDRLGLQICDGYHVMMHPRLAALYLAVLAETAELPPVIAGSGMVAGCLVGATCNALDQRRQVLAAEPTGYLLNLRNELEPSDTVSRIRSAVRRAVSRASSGR
jgi:hypothetical protein